MVNKWNYLNLIYHFEFYHLYYQLLKKVIYLFDKNLFLAWVLKFLKHLIRRQSILFFVRSNFISIKRYLFILLIYFHFSLIDNNIFLIKKIINKKVIMKNKINLIVIIVKSPTNYLSQYFRSFDISASIYSLFECFIKESYHLKVFNCFSILITHKRIWNDPRDYLTLIDLNSLAIFRHSFVFSILSICYNT